MDFILFISLVIVLRLAELLLARRNENRVRKLGAVEYGRGHYPVMVSMHLLFLVACIAEYSVRPAAPLQPVFFTLFIISTVLKICVILSLGDYWNTRILRIPGMQLVNTGIYRYVKHPNYILVVAEIALIPLCFKLYATAIVFSILNGCMLYVRITEENKALK